MKIERKRENEIGRPGWRLMDGAIGGFELNPRVKTHGWHKPYRLKPIENITGNYSGQYLSNNLFWY